MADIRHVTHQMLKAQAIGAVIGLAFTLMTGAALIMETI